MAAVPARIRSFAKRVLRKLKRLVAQGLPAPVRARVRAAWRRLRGGPTPGEGAPAGWHLTAPAHVVRELAAEAFDPVWYVRRYPDVARQNLDPLTHYLTCGRSEGRSPTLTHARAVAWVKTFGET